MESLGYYHQVSYRASEWTEKWRAYQKEVNEESKIEKEAAMEELILLRASQLIMLMELTSWDEDYTAVERALKEHLERIDTTI